MDKTNLNTRNTPTNTTQAQQQTNRAAASAPQRTGTTVSDASAHRAQQAPSLSSAAGSNPRTIQDASNKKLDIAYNILSQLFTKLDSDPSAMAKILQMLNKKDANTQMTLAQQFIRCSHTYGLKFLQCLGSIVPSFLIKSLDQNLEDLDNRKTILNTLSFTLGETSFYGLSYHQDQKFAIEAAENILLKLLASPVYLQCSKTSIGVFQLAQVINKRSVEQIQGYIFEYCNRLKRGAWSETSPEQFALYFVYGFLGKNLDVLGRLLPCLEVCLDAEFKGQAEQKISECFGFFLNDLREVYIKDYAIQAEDYDEIILYICKTVPKVLDTNLNAIFQFCERSVSPKMLVHLFPVKNSQGQVLLDLIYEKQHAQLIGLIEANLVSSVQTISNAGTIVQHLDLPHVSEHLRLAAEQNLEIFTKEERFRYLLLSLLIQDLGCVEHFKSLQIETEEEAQRLKVSLLMLAEHVFGFYNPSLIDFLSSYGLKNTPLKRRELFFEILEILKPLKVLEWLTLTPQLLAVCLKQDCQIDLRSSSPKNFDYMLENLKKIGFDLHYIDPETGHNILSAAYELERTSGNFPLFRKLLSLGCNPFLLQNDGMSVYSHLSPARNDEKVRAAAILQDLNLYEHPFLPLSFTKNVLNNNRLDQRDEQGRTPLMLFVMTNIDITNHFGKNLQKLEAKHLEAKDNKGWTAFDYAEHNRDHRALALLKARKEALEQKANKPSLFRQAAGLAAKLATPTAPNVEASKSPAAPSSSSKKRQARKLRAKNEASLSPLAPTTEITLDYNPETGTSTTSIKEIHNQAADAIAKREAKAAAKQKKKEDKQNSAQNIDEKEGLFAKAKKKIKVVATTLEAAKNIATHPQAFMLAVASKLSQAKAGKPLAQGQKVYNVTKEKPVAKLEDGFWLGNSATLVDLANEAIGKGKLEILPSIIKTLEAIDEAIRGNPRLKIDRMKILEVLQWIVGGKIEYGKGSHLNLRYAGGVFTIPQNKDGSDNADIFYVKEAAKLMAQQLRGLLLGYELSQSTLSSEDLSGSDERKLSNSNETSSSEERKDETPEPSESSESKG